MKAVDKLICNELAARRSVVLPDVGTLSVERVSATQTGKNTISVPGSRVVFSRTITVGEETVVDLIAGLGMDRSRAEETYREWLAGARRGSDVHIEGAGTVSNGNFRPDDHLDQLLNPIREKSVELHSRRGCTPLWAGFLIPLVFVVGGILLYHCWVTGCCKKDKTEIGCSAPAVVATPETPETPDIERIMAEEAPTVAEPGVVATMEEAAPEKEAPAPVAEAPATSAGPMYYVVAGVFDLESNADNFIRLYRNAYPDVSPQKAPYKKGKFIVYLYSSESGRQAENMAARYRYNHYNYDLWVYKSE